MNKQEVIKKMQSEAKHHCGWKRCYKDGCTENVELDIAIDIVNRLDEPEKPVVPNFVDDMIRKRKEMNQSLQTTLVNLGVFEEAARWVRNNSETFAKAWLFGYGVEKEKLYTVELPNPNSLDYLVLKKDRRGKIYVAWYCTDSWREDERVWLTEDEIKESFDWAWQFAEEVER